MMMERLIHMTTMTRSLMMARQVSIPPSLSYCHDRTVLLDDRELIQ